MSSRSLSFSARVAVFAAVAAVARTAATDPTPVPPKRAVAAAQDALDKLANDVKSWGGTLGAVAVDVDTGAVVAARGEHLSLNPASNAKLATAAVALRTLGPGHRFVTGLYGKVEHDTVASLVLRGDGDPSLATRDLYGLARDLVALGVRRVKAIHVDQSAFDDAYVPPAFEQQPNEWAYFRAPVAPVSLNENTISITIRPTKKGSDAFLSVDPPGFVDASGAVQTTAKADHEKVTLALEPRPGRLAARLGGTLPEGRALHLVRRVDDPRLLAGYALRAALKDVGIEVTGDPKLGGEREKRLLASHLSPRLGELLFALGKDSDNFYAETLFKALATVKRTPARDAGATPPATAADAADVVTKELRALDAFEDGVVIKNGSGLFDANRTTPSALAHLLRAAYVSSAIAPEFVAQLSVGGVDGTLHGRFKAWTVQRAVRAKTGTLDAVAAISGYVLAPPGKAPIAFVVIANGISGHVGKARPAMDKFVDALARDRWGAPPEE